MANLVRAKISALGTFTPPRLLTNADLEKMVETSNDWIVERTGIRQRHIVDQGMATSDLAIEAAKEALQQRQIPASEIEAIFLGTVTPDMFFPATACIVQDKIGAKGAWGYDISAACSGFVYALQTAVKFVESGAHKKVMAIGADVMSSIINYQDRATCVIFGDGAGAVVVEPATDDNCFIDFIHEVDGSGACSLYMPGGGSRNPSTHDTVDRKMHYVHQDGQAVFRYAVRKMAETAEAVLKRNGFTGKDVALFVPHQANRRIIMSSAERLGLPEERIIINIDEFGNTTAGTIPLALESARQQGRLKKGDLVLIAAVGAGFTVGACLLRWAC
ncbi:MAG TPA: beta-ketoacyl-ACP synthase III [Candidatus Angelobacter sp.]|nr:beta-ketoacyl-ACP synthase III [Candidatus Angelobacter sp.]